MTGSDPTLTVISWRNIPAQVIAARGRERVRRELPDRFQTAIDRAAMKAGLVGTDAYLEQWIRTSRPCNDDLDAEADAEANRLMAEYDQKRLERLVSAAGNEENA
ncbi:MAG: virulence factor [Acidimicrobiia bacterium]|nr:virulence factor [Acidimicrobiia bacterium]